MRKICLITVFFMVLLITSCTKKPQVVEQPELSQIKSICELATLECYYHNVAKYEKDLKDFLWIDKYKKFWYEYSGQVTVGIDASLIDVSILGETVKIGIPQAKVLETKIDKTSLDENSIIVEKGSESITAGEYTTTIAEAQENMENTATNNKALLDNAQIRAKLLIEEYITNMGNATGKNYKIQWYDIEPEVGSSEEAHSTN